MNSFYSPEELQEIGFKHLGENVLISRKTSIYSPQNISIGSNVRIDDFCILSGKIEMGNYIHISAYTGLFAGDVGVILKDFVTISSRNSVYAISDDYSGESMTNPMIPKEYRKVREAEVVLEKHVIVGSGSCILPGVYIGEGTAVGSMSLVNKSLDPWKIYGGVPCKVLKERKKELLEKEGAFMNEIR